MTDPITDMLNRIRSAQAVGKTDIVLPYSQLKHEIAALFVKEGFLTDAKKAAKQKSKILKLALKYTAGIPAVEGAKRVSRPGQRIYVGYSEIKKVRGGFGRTVLSTSKGFMTGQEAKKAKLGGEVLLEVW